MMALTSGLFMAISSAARGRRRLWTQHSRLPPCRRSGLASSHSRRRRGVAAFRAALAVASAAIGLAAGTARGEAGRAHEMERLVASQPRAVGRVAELGWRLLQPARQRVPVEPNGALAFASA